MGIVREMVLKYIGYFSLQPLDKTQQFREEFGAMENTQIRMLIETTEGHAWRVFTQDENR